MTTWRQPIHVNIGLLTSHARRLEKAADRLDNIRSQLVSAVGVLTWNASTPNHGAIAAAYARAIAQLGARADAIRALARHVVTYAEVMSMIEAAFAVAPRAPGLGWGGMPSLVMRPEAVEGPAAWEWAKTGWDTFDTARSVTGLGEARYITVYGFQTERVPVTIVETQWGRFGGYDVPVFNRTEGFAERQTAVAIVAKQAGWWPWVLKGLNAFGAGMGLLSVALGIHDLLHPKYQGDGKEIFSAEGNLAGIASGGMATLGAIGSLAGIEALAALASNPVGWALAAAAVAIPTAQWREDVYEQWDAHGGGPIARPADAVQLLNDPLKQLDAAGYLWHTEVRLAGQAYYDHVALNLGPIHLGFGLHAAGRPVALPEDRYQYSAAVGAALKELKVQHPGVNIDSTSVARQVTLTFPNGDRQVIPL